MTSKKSSLNPMAFTYKKALKSKLPVSVVLWVLVFAAFGDAGAYIRDYFSYKRAGEADLASQLKNAYVYLFNSNSSDLGIVEFLFEAVLIISAAYIAVSLFGFLLRKNSVNVIYSLGISRNRYFIAKLLAGVSVIVIGIGLPMVIVTIMNAALFGMSGVLIHASLFAFVKLSSVMLWTFAVFTLATVMTGSLFETIIEGSVVFISPLLINSVVGFLMAITVYGSPWTSGFSSFAKLFFDVDGNIINTNFRLFDFEDYILPLSNSDDLTGFFCLEKGADAPELPVSGAVIFLAAIICVFVASLLINSKRNAEKAGFMGTSPLLQGYCVVTVGPYLAAFISASVSNYAMSMKGINTFFFLAAFIIMVIGYTVVDFICVRSFKKYTKRLKYLGIELAVFAVISALIAAGANNAYGSVPQKQEIKSVSVSIPDTYLESQDGYSYGSFIQDDVMRVDNCVMVHTDNLQMVGNFTDEGTIGFITEMNEKLADIKGNATSDYTDFTSYGDRTFSYTIRIEYTLANEKKTSRMYPVADDEIISSLYETILSTDSAKKTAAGCVALNSLEDDIYLVSPNGSGNINPDVLKAENHTEARTELSIALGEDIMNGTLPLTLKSEEKAMGYIAGGGKTYPIYENMKNTLSVLTEYDLMKCFENTEEPVKISIISYDDGCHYEGDNSTGIICYTTFGDGDSAEDNYEYYDTEGNLVGAENAKLPDNATVITDPAKIAEAEDSIRLYTTCIYNGSFVQMEYEDGRIIYAYMPAYLI